METAEHKENLAIDLGKLVATIFIIMIHCSPMAGEIPIVIRGGIWRLGVPFFMVSSGFFLSIRGWNRETVKGYVLRMLRVYLLWCIIYFPLYIQVWVKDDRNLLLRVILFFRQFLIGAIWGVLWFFPALIGAVLLFYGLYKWEKLSQRQLLCLGIGLYFVGILGNMWFPVIQDIPVIGDVMGALVLVFGYTRNFLFEGLPCMIFGYLLYIHQNDYQTAKFVAMLGFGLLLLIIEPLAISKFYGVGSLDMGVGMMLSGVSLVAILNHVGRMQSCGEKIGKVIRKITLPMLLVHHLIIEMVKDFCGVGFSRFILALGLSFCFSIALMYLEKKKYLTWLRHLH